VKIFIIHASAGHGHKKVAEAIYQEFSDKSLQDTQVEVIDLLDYSTGFFKKGYPLVYYLLVKYFPSGWGWGFSLFNNKSVLNFINPLRRLFNKLQIGKLLAYIDREKPDYIINTHFLLPSVLGPLVEKNKSKCRMMTVVTDYKVHGFWVNPGQDLYVGMCETTKKGLVAWGIPDDKIALWGIPVQPKFRRHLGRHLLAHELGLEEGRFTVLLTSGSFGIGPAHEMLKALEEKSSKIQAMVVCGNNEKLYLDLVKQEFSYPVKVFGYVNNMDQLMEVSDLAIIKPGGSTSCELLVKACPFLMLKPIPGQEEGNGEVLVLEGISQFINTPQDLLDKWSSFENPAYAKRLREAISGFAKPEAGRRIVEYIYAQLR
jgi:processive 1,2-diacylglycerol beta-glucosyltransferase